MNKLVVLLLLLIHFKEVQAQDSINNQYLRASLLTCGAGEELYTTFGHTGIRITDSRAGTDVVYNYGTFDGFDPQFEVKFMQGKLLYYISKTSYEVFIDDYQQSQRFVKEQELLMTHAQRQRLLDILETNLLPDNKHYKYDFTLDNCATRVRDVLAKAYGPGFGWGITIPSNEYVTYRHIINQYLFAHHWERVGINILLGAPVDERVHTTESMFIPDYLQRALSGATFNTMNAANPLRTVLPDNQDRQAGLNMPFLLFTVIFLLTLLAFIKPIAPIRDLLQFLLLFVSGLLGCLMLLMWWGTDHQACRNNFNIFWALPTNLIIAFLPRLNKSLYGIAGIIFLFLLLVLEVTLYQSFIWLELTPVLLSLFIIYRSFIIPKKKQAQNGQEAKGERG